MADNLRIEELRRRVQKDPASIAFAQLAEEYRRAGHYEEAIKVCRAGLDQHPAYLSARVTLGRALFEIGRLEEAGSEFSLVLESAPDNVIALRALADIHQRTRKLSHAREQSRASDVESDEPEQRLTSPRVSSPDSRASSPGDPVVAELEAWLEVINARLGRAISNSTG